MGKPNWWWGIHFGGLPQPAAYKGISADLDECKRRFKLAWSGLRPRLTEADIEQARRHKTDIEKRAKWPGTKFPDRT